MGFNYNNNKVICENQSFPAFHLSEETRAFSQFRDHGLHFCYNFKLFK